MEQNEIRLEAQDCNQQGAILLKAGNIEAAREKFDKAIELDPMLMDSYKNYGDLYMALDQYQDAKNSYKKALLIEKNGLLYFLYGNACFMNDEMHEGLEHYNMAINEGYDDHEMMYFMGMAYEYMNDDNMALRFFQRASQKNPSKPDYMIKKIEVMIRMGMYEGANKETDILLTKAPELFDGYHIKTMLFFHDKKYEEAIHFSKAASERFPEDADLLYDYAKALSLSGQLDGALDVITRAKEMKYFEGSKRMFTMLEGQIHAEAQRYTEAKSCCEACVELETADTFDGEARFMLMNLYITENDFVHALEQAERIVGQDLEDMYYYAALYYRPLCHKKLGQDEEARKLYKEAGSIYRVATLKNPAAIDIYLYRAFCFKDLEEYDKAIEILDFITGLSDEIAEVHMLRADIYHIQGKDILEKEERERAYSLKPDLKPEESAADAAESAGE